MNTASTSSASIALTETSEKPPSSQPSPAPSYSHEELLQLSRLRSAGLFQFSIDYKQFIYNYHKTPSGRRAQISRMSPDTRSCNTSRLQIKRRGNTVRRMQGRHALVALFDNIVFLPVATARSCWRLLHG